MRDELGSCAPGSFTAVALFYIYGAAAGPAVARCESHDSSAGNRDGPVILAPLRLHVTPLHCPLGPSRRSSALTAGPDRRPTQDMQAACMLTHQQSGSFYGHFSPSVSAGPPLSGPVHFLCPCLIRLIRPYLFIQVSNIRSEICIIMLLRVWENTLFSLSWFNLQHPPGEVESSTCPQTPWNNSTLQSISHATGYTVHQAQHQRSF